MSSLNFMADLVSDNLHIQLLLAFIVSWLFLLYVKTPKNLPPGPWGIPVIGYKLFFGKKPHITVANLKKKYGDIIRINMGPEYAIFLTSYKAIKEALVKQADVFSGRPFHHIPDILKNKRGIIGSSGEVWSELRRFSLSKLRDFGFGKSTLEPRIKEEIIHFVQEIEAFKGKPIPDIGEFIRKSVTNVICIIMTGRRFDYTDKVFNNLLHLSNEHLSSIGIDRVVSLIPQFLRFKILLKALGLKSPLTTTMDMIQVISKIVDKFDTDHIVDSDDNFIDAWLTESRKLKNQFTNLTKTQLPTVLFDLFLAGSDTTTNTLGWSLLYMIEHPDIQAKVHEEINNVIGKERTPSMSDQKLMPYTEAILMEVNRIITIVPFSLLHCNNTDAILMGKFIPKESTIITNLWAVHNDPEIFPEPEKFKPERFLTDNGKIKRIEEWIPFSMGKSEVKTGVYKKPQVTIANLRKRYGDIIRINMGSEYAIFLTSFKAIKEALVKQAGVFADRPPHHIPVEIKDTPGLFRSSGEVWSQLRRFSLTNSRDFGLGKSHFESQINDEIHHFLAEVEAFKGKPIPNIGEFVHKSVTNLVCSIILGERFDYNDKLFTDMLHSAKDHFRRLGIDRVIPLFPPLLIKAVGLKTPIMPALGIIKAVSNIVEKFDAKYEAEGRESRENFIDAWFTQSLSKKKQTTYLTKPQLSVVLFDFFIAGSETSTNTLEWGLLYMIKHPDIQARVQEEIDHVIGRERFPSMSDQKLMPYTEATLMEIRSSIITSLWGVHHDPEIFPEPEKFKPERFLTDNGQIKRVEEYIPFSMGKRQCMGESLAKMELFLYFTNMLQNFTFKKVNGTIDFDYNYAIVTMPKLQPIYAISPLMWDLHGDDLQTQLLIGFITIFVLWLLLTYLKTPKNLPPGPWGLPLVGCKFFLGSKPHMTIANMRKKYGDLIRINMGNGPTVFINSFEAIKEMLIKQGDVFAAKQQEVSPRELVETPGVLRSNGEVWSELRRFSLTTLRNLGLGKSNLEPRIMDEIQFFLKEIAAFKGQPIDDVGEFLRKSIANVINVMMTGNRFDYKDKLLIDLLNISKEHFKRVGVDKPVYLIPRAIRFKPLLNILGIKSPGETTVKIMNVYTAMVDNYVKTHDTDRDDNFIGAWLAEAKKAKAKYITRKHLSGVLLDLFFAGSDTTTNTLGWCLLYMIEHPDVQARVQKEIDDVIGSERVPTMTDQKLMPYTEAVLTEVSRIVTIVPLVGHSCQADTTVFGKYFPKGINVSFNLWGVHHDPEFFPEPNKFKPDRFLTDTGQMKRVMELIPFSMGKRQCLGESLARMELFLFFTCLLQYFTFKKAGKSIDFNYTYSVVMDALDVATVQMLWIGAGDDTACPLLPSDVGHEGFGLASKGRIWRLCTLTMSCLDIISNVQTQLLVASIILITTWVLSVYLKYLKTPKNLPPGPWGLPRVGYKFFLGQKPHITIAKMRKQYGDLIRINMGDQEVIVLTSFKAIKGALANQADIFAGRPAHKMPDIAGIVMSNGEQWSDLRRFSLSTLRDFGFGKSSLEPQIKDEIHYFLEELRSFKEQPIPDISVFLRKSITNVICILMSGKRFDYQHEMFNKLLTLSNEIIRFSGINRLSALIPNFLKYNFVIRFLGIHSAYPALIEMRKVLTTFVDEHAEMHHEDITENSFIDVWLTESLKENNKSKHLTKKQLPGVLFDLFAAGSDTTTNTIGWSLLYMIEHVNIQAKVQQEIEDVIGRERTPSMTDQKLMPYTEAVLMEVNRIVTIVPLSVAHRTLSDTTLLGRFIPKGMTIMPNLWAVHHDPEIFPEPYKFKPERFLTDDGQLKRMEEFLPFSMVLAITWLLFEYLKTPKNLPPGPWGLPLVGYKFFLGKKPQITVANMRKQYGDVITINMGNERVIFLTSFKAVKEALSKQADIFAGRPGTNLPNEIKDTPGILKSSGEIWSELRRFSLSKLRDFGFGKSSLEPQIKEEINYFIDEVKSFKGQAIPNIGEFLHKSITNVICIIMTGRRFDYQHKAFNKLLDLSTLAIRQSGIDRAVSLIPQFLRFRFLLKLLGIQSGTLIGMKMKDLLKIFVDKRADMHDEAMTENSFIDVWLTESLNKNNQYKYLSKKQLPMVLLDLFLAGSDTTTNTLGWSLLYMIENRDIQAKVQQEIDDVIGKERTPSISDQKLMPYTDAVLMEVNRIVTIVPFSVLHSTRSVTTLLGNFIPNGTTIVPNLWAVHHDPEHFPEPHKFKPERFLTDNGQLKRVEEFIPFSIGKRQCMGEGLARMELFLYFTSMLQQFSFKKVNDKIDFDFTYAVVTQPKAQPIYAIPR
uniref:Cytochrome P450 2U1 n=1 Tax=Strigamia maritima TaxID=126957 RepID=T1IQ14_STRMM